MNLTVNPLMINIACLAFCRSLEALSNPICFDIFGHAHPLIAVYVCFQMLLLISKQSRDYLFHCASYVETIEPCRLATLDLIDALKPSLKFVFPHFLLIQNASP